jgi:DnaK suppressor protein
METARARELLRRERQRIEQALAKLRLPGGEELAGQDEMADSASQLYEEEFGEGQADDLWDRLASVERAEGRLIDGNYGLSVESGKPIPDERLEAVPTAERTVEEQVRFERQTRYPSRSTPNGKSGLAPGMPTSPLPGLTLGEHLHCRAGRRPYVAERWNCDRKVCQERCRQGQQHLVSAEPLSADVFDDLD